MNAMTPTRMEGPEVERLLFHWPRVVEAAPAGWPRDFALSIVTQSRRRGWSPSPKQADLMRRMVGDLFTYGSAGHDDPLIEEDTAIG